MLQILLIMTVSLLFLLFQHSIVLKEEKKQIAYDTVPVKAFIESEQNMLADKKLPFDACDQIEETGFVKSSYYEMKLNFYIINPMRFVRRNGDIADSFFATSRLSEFDPVKAGYLEVTWLNGMNEERFHAGEPYAILPKTLYDEFMNEEVNQTFYVAGGLHITDNYEFLEDQTWFPFTIAGYFIENEDPTGRKYDFKKDEIIILLPMAREELLNFGFSFSDKDVMKQYGTYMNAEFELKNTRHLNELREKLKDTDFGKPFQELMDQRMAGLTFLIEDSLLQQTVQPLEASIRFMKYLTPILLLIGMLIGFFLSILGFGQNKREYAIMRSLGTGKKRSFLYFLEENFIVCLAGGALAFLIGEGIDMSETTNVAWLFLFTGFYILGSITSLILLSRTEPLKILTSKE